MNKKLYPLQVLPILFTRKENKVEKKQTYTSTINTIPSDATVLFSLNDKKYTSEAITAEEGTKVYYKISKTGYKTVTGVFTLYDGIIEITLQKDEDPEPETYYLFVDGLGIVDENNYPISFEEIN